MEGQNYVNEVAFSQPVINIGADPGNDIVLRGKGVLPFHAMLNYSGDVWHLLPLDESVSMRINGRGVSVDGTPVQSGAVLSLGDYNLTLSLNGVNADILISQAASAVTAAQNVSGQTDSAGGSILLSVTDYVPAELEAGSSLEFGVSVTNAGPLVANMQLQLQGIPSAWVQIIPPVLNLNEGRTGTFTIRINPPRSSSAEAGYYQLHFVAISPNYPRETGTADTSLTILPYSEFLVNGPTPRRLNLSRRKPSDSTEFVIINNSNAASNFVVRAYDDANELNFTYRSGMNSLMQGQDTVMIRPGDNERVPLQVEAKKRPLFGLVSRTHNYYTTVAPADRPGDAQSLVGEVQVRPLIHVFWLFLVLILGLIAAFFIFQPYIYSFEGISGKHTEVIQAGNSAWVSWRVSRFASKITLDDGKTVREIPNQGEEYITPSASTTLKIRAENFISNLFGISLYEKQISILLIPKLPTIDRLDTDRTNLYYNQPVTINWAVSSNADTADLVADKQRKSLTAEQFSGSQQSNFIADTLISLRAVNASGYEVKSVFLNVKPDKITLDHFIAWVRPNGIAVPADNDVRRTTRWGSLQALYGLNNTTPARVNPMPDAQSNTIVIPDTYNSGSGSSAGMNPEQQMVAQLLSTPVSETELRGGSMDPAQLLVGPSITATPTVPTVAAPDRSGQTLVVPSGSPQSASASREFTVKLAEIVEDSSLDSGYRVIQYFPDHVLQAGEEVLLEWSVDGVSKVKIDNLSSDDLNAVDSSFIYPEKSTNYVLNAEIGNVKKAYSLPVNVAGAADDGQGSGLKCDLKANSTKLAVPGTVMLTWTGGGNNRVQLISSAKAEAEKAEADKKAEEEAKARGEEYKPDPNAPLTGGIIADYLEPAGFMRVNIDQQTTFVLNCFDGNGNVICTKDVEIKYTGGVDKLDLKFRITRVTNTRDETVDAFYVGQTAQFTVALTDFEKGKDPTGNIMITDGDSSCTMTLPKTTCSMVMKHAGTRTVTAVYSGDDTYNKKTATTRVRVLNKRNLTLDIVKITDEKGKPQDTYVVGQNVLYTVRLRRFNSAILPTGTIKLSDGTSTCTVNVGAPDESGYITGTCSMAPKTAGTLPITADYSGDEVYNTAQAAAEIEVAAKRDITFEIKSITNENNEEQKYYVLGQNVRITVALSDYEEGLNPTGSFVISDGDSSCTATIPVYSCTLAPKRTGERTVTAIYSGDGNYASRKDTGAFEVREKIPTTIEITNAYKQDEKHAAFDSKLSWVVPDDDKDKTPTGTITYTLIGNETAADLGKCVYNFSDEKLNCEGSLTAKVTGRTVNFKITDLLIPNLSDRIKAEYSGDVYFSSSSSSQILFKKIPTSIVIDKAMKNGDKIADLTVTLKADENSPSDQKPVGKITFKSDANANNTTTVCVLVLNDPPKFENCSGEGKIEDVKIGNNGFEYVTYSITGMTVNTVLGESIIAQYSGDALYKPSASEAAEFDTITKSDTSLEITDAYKSAENLVNYTATLKWELPETEEGAEPPVPSGTVTFKIGSESCKLTFDGAEMTIADGEDSNELDPHSFSCSGEKTKIRLIERKDPAGDEDGLFTWKFEQVLLSSGTADRIQGEYSGDSNFSSSSSLIVLFTKIPTALKVTDMKKTDETHLEIHTELTWDENMSAYGFTPTGTVKFTVGSGVCTLDLTSMDLDCESAAVTVKPSPDPATEPLETPKKLLIDITGMKLTDKTADIVKLEYSGDVLFMKSVSNAAFNKIPPGLKLTIMDEAGETHDAYPVNGKIRAEIEMTNALPELYPTGTVDITIDTEKCTITLPQTACFMTLPATPGDRNAAAKYAGDAVYTADSSTEKVIINTKKMVTLKLSHSDTDGTEQEAYYINQKIRITADLEGDDASQPATGEITISAGANACSINYPAETSCVITASQIGTMMVSGSYGGDIYYNSAKASIDLEVVRHELQLDITDVTSTRFDNETQDYMRQPYYVYDDKARNGQEVRVVAALSGLVSGKDPTGTVTIMNQDNITLCTYALPQDKCTFNVSKFGDEGRFGEIRLKARYEGDSFYAPADAEGTVNVQKRIPVKLTINEPLGMLPYHTSEQFELVFAYDRTLPDTYGVGPEADKTRSTLESEWGHGTVTFTLRNSESGSEKECKLDLYTGKLDDACVKPETEEKEDGKTLFILPETTVEREDTDEGFVYRIYAMDGGSPAADKIKVKYDAVSDNDLFYFYPSADADVKFIDIVPENKGKVELEITDFIEVENARGHAFLTAQLKYAPEIAEKYQTKPHKKLTIIAKNTNDSKSYVYDLAKGTIDDSTVKVTITDPENNPIEFVIKDVRGPWDIEKLELIYSCDGSGDSCDPDLFFEMKKSSEVAPTLRSVNVKIDNAVNADKNTLSTIFSIEEILSDLEKYGIFDGKVTLTVFDGVNNAECKFDRETMQFEAPCQGTVTAVDGRYVVKEASGDEEHTELLFDFFDRIRVSLYSPYLGADSPGDEAEIEMIPISITVSDAVTMNSRDLFATLNVNIDETDPATGTDLTWARIRELYDVVPKSADWHTAAKSCHFDLSSGEPRCDTASMDHGVFSGGTATYMLYKWQISPTDKSADALLYDHRVGNTDQYYGYFVSRPSDGAIRDDTPVIEVKNAMRSSQNNAYVTFTITYPVGLLESKYQALTEIVFENQGGPTGYYDTTTGSFPDYVPVDGTLTKTGNRYVVRDLHGKNRNFSDHDHFGIWLSGPYGGYRDTTYAPAYYSRVTALLSITDATRFDREFAFMQTIFSIDDVDWLTEYGLKLEGTFNFIARGADETGGERVKTCSLVMPAGSFSCDPAQSDAEAVVKYTGGITWRFTLRNMTADTYNSEPLFTVTGYNSYLFDVQNPIVSYTRFTEARPGLIVTNALKSSAETTSVTFTLNNYSDMWDTDYRVFGDLKLQLSKGEPPDVGDYHYILADWKTIRSLSDGVSHYVDLGLGYTADITKNGATIEIKNFTMKPENYRYFLVGVLYEYDRNAYEFSGYRALTNNLGFGTFSPVSLSVDIEP